MRFWILVAAFVALVNLNAGAQELLKIIEPGTGYSRLKQWAIERELVFENFTKDSMVIRGSVRESGQSEYAIHLLVRFLQVMTMPEGLSP